MIELKNLSIADLLNCHSLVLDELKSRQATRSSNNPTGDYAEFLFSRAFDWTLETNSKAGYDALNHAGDKFQIKSRRIVNGSASERRLGTMRNIEQVNFDYLAAVLFNKDYKVSRAIIIPHSCVLRLMSKQSHVNGCFITLRDSIWNEPEANDVTDQLKDAEMKLGIEVANQRPEPVA